MIAPAAFPDLADYPGEPSHYVQRFNFVFHNPPVHLQLLCRPAGIVPVTGFKVRCASTDGPTCLTCFHCALEIYRHVHRP